MRKWIDLLEHASLDFSYHGTSSKFLSSIRENGLVPVPPQKVYDGNFTSYTGAYFSDTFSVAAYRASCAVDKFGGEPIVIKARITNDAIGDEDAIKDFFDQAMGEVVIEDFDNEDEDDRRLDYEDAVSDIFKDYFQVDDCPREFWQLVGLYESGEMFSPEWHTLCDKFVRWIGPTPSGGNHDALDFRVEEGLPPSDIVAIVQVEHTDDPSIPPEIVREL